jgi:hypothetical protein
MVAAMSKKRRIPEGLTPWIFLATNSLIVQPPV